MSKPVFSQLYVTIALLSFAGHVSAEQKYTYVKASLNYPWVMFFVFLALIAIPFLIIIVLSWRQHRKNDSSRAAVGES